MPSATCQQIPSPTRGITGAAPHSHPAQVLADVRGNGISNDLDVTYLVNFVSEGGPEPIDGQEIVEFNCDESITSQDVFYPAEFA